MISPKRLRSEYLREFIGEGQIFFMYKRLYININSDENGYDTNTYGAKEETLRVTPCLPAKLIIVKL